LKVSADLVVLSACETGLGKMVRGEGLVGLTRAFMYAGAPSVVVSLWSVADASTASLMDKFYGNLVERSEGKTESLRLAKLGMIETAELAHPFNWAPFVLSGDWQ
jgi:CHAT domain-containing protein